MKRFAHRGYSKHCTENTLPSFKSAISISDGIECDVWRTRDGVWVIHHNNYLDGIGFISEHTLTELRQIKGSLCLLIELLELLRESIPVFLELKGYVTNEMVDNLAVLLKKYPDVTYYVGGFCSKQVYYLAKYFNPDQIVLNISDGSATTLMDIPAGIISISQEQLHSDLHQLIGDRQIWVYTVNDQYNYLKCDNLGVTTIITDDPTLAFLPG